MRFEAKLKLGYYPANLRAIQMIASRLSPSKDAVLFDPCAGTGEAVGQLAGLLGIPPHNVYAIELEQGRAESLAKDDRIGNPLGPADALVAKVGRGFSIAYVNPPFDFELGGGYRVEQRFAEWIAAKSIENGVVVMVIPEPSLYEVAESLRPYAKSIDWEQFPSGYRPYREIAVYAVMRGKCDHHSITRHRLMDLRSFQPIPVPAGRRLGYFESGGYTHQQLADLIVCTEAFELVQKPLEVARKKLRPPLELSTGHLALLLASGDLNGLVTEPGKPSHVVRGTARKVSFEKESKIVGGKYVKTYSERIQLLIRCLLPNGELKTLVSCGADPIDDETEVELQEDDFE